MKHKIEFALMMAFFVIICSLIHMKHKIEKKKGWVSNTIKKKNKLVLYICSTSINQILKQKKIIHIN